MLFSVVLLFWFLCSPSGAKVSLWLRISFAETSASASSKDTFDAPLATLYINNKTSLQSLKQILTLSECEKCYGDDMVPIPQYNVGGHYIGCDIYFEYDFLFSHYHFVFPSGAYWSWREYVDNVLNGAPGNGFVLVQ